MLFRSIKYNYARDNFFSELKDLEIEKERLGTLQLVDPYVGKYFSIDWVKRKVLKQGDDEIELIQQQMDSDGSAAQLQQAQQQQTQPQ